MQPKIPRLKFDELDPSLADLLRPRVARLNYLGEFFRYTAHQPRALSAFIQFTEEAKSRLDKNLVEVIALTAATTFRNDYERNQHERLSVRLGYRREWVTEVEALDPVASEHMNDMEKAVQRFTLAVVEQVDAPEQLDALAALLGHERAIAALMISSRYVAHALMVNALDLTPPVPSIFEDGFGG